MGLKCTLTPLYSQQLLSLYTTNLALIICCLLLSFMYVNNILTTALYSYIMVSKACLLSWTLVKTEGSEKNTG